MFNALARVRPTLRSEFLVLIVSAWMVATANGAWWRAVGAGRSWLDPSSWLFAACCFVALVALHFALLAPLSHRGIVKPLLALLVLVSAGAAYYMRNFAVLIDPTMVQNILHTDAREAGDLLTAGLFGWIAGWSMIPLLLIGFVKIERRPALRSLVVRIASIVIAVVVAVLAVLPISRDFTSLMRNQRTARYLITPGNLIYGLAVNSLNEAAAVNTPRETLGADAHLVHVALTGKPRVLVLVIGETARAANFSLLGYRRETNPQLAKLDVAAFGDVSSCGTSTAVSVPCMFSALGREHYDDRRIRNSEGLLDVLVRAGYAVKWVDNQSGCKGVCKGAGIEYTQLCDGDACQDGALVLWLAAELPRIDHDTVIVLHMMGNHGPAYFRRYPRDFRQFLPDCATAQLRDCSREQVVNAYDNAILYTDHVLAGIIEALAHAGNRLDGSMIYVSDHGESLGEHGLYLHGVPYAIAPSQQTRVPMIVWVSRPLRASGDVDVGCLRRKTHAGLSHDNLFHSVLGLMNVDTAVYRVERDIFDGCRGVPGRAYAHAMQ
jgi:lipid A ethanolaminephosphotransferase